MKARDFDSILSDWNIDNEGERWILKKQFLRNNPNYYCLDDFVDFLKLKYGSPRHDSNQRTQNQ